METIEKLEKLMVELKEESVKFFEKGNKSAGVSFITRHKKRSFRTK